MLRSFACSFALLVVLSTALASATYAQTHYSKHFTMRDGLPSNSIRTIFKDSRGVMWVGTDAGVCTFDGKSFKKFPLLKENRSNTVWAIAEDGDGNLWFGTYGSGLFRYDGEKVSGYQKPKLPSNHIRRLSYSKRYKCLLIGTEQGFCVLKDSIFKAYPTDPSNPSKRVQVMGFTETDKGVNYYTYLHYAYTYFPSEDRVAPIPKESPINSESSSCCYISTMGDTLVGDFKKGLKIISSAGTTKYDGMGQIFDIQEDKEGVLWVAAWSYTDMAERGGFYRIEKGSKQPLHANSMLKIDDRLAWCIYIDENGSKYLGTDDNGFYFVPSNGITNYDASFFGLEKLEVYDIDYINGNLWFTAGSNLVVGNLGEGFKVMDSKYLFKNSKSGYPSNRNHTKTIGNVELMDIAQDSSGNIWVGSNRRMYRFTSLNQPIYYYNYGIKFGQRIYCDRKGKLLGTGWYYLCIVPNIYEKWDSTVVKSLDYPTDIGRIVKRDDEVWFSSWVNGLYRYKNGQFKTFRNDKRIPSNTNDICIDKQGRIITGTNDGVVRIYEGKDSLLQRYTLSESEGVVGTSVSWLFCSASNLLWVGTNSGINVISLDKLYTEGKADVRFFNEDEGYDEFTVSSIVEDKNGDLWLGGKDNLVRIEPDKLFSHRTWIGNINLSSVRVNNREYDWDKNSDVNRWTRFPNRSVKLKYNQNSLVFAVTSPNVYNPNKDIYSVYLDGFDKDTSNWSSKQEATYTNLPPNDYRLIIKGKNVSSQQEYKPMVFPFKIESPWWSTWWFYTCASVFVLLFVFILFKSRVKRASERARVEQRISELRLEALKSQMNPHFIFNAFNSIQLYILQQDTKSALAYMNSFAKLIRMTLENSSKKAILLSEEIEFLENYLFLEQRRVSNLYYSFIIDSDLDAESVLVPPMIIQPLVENSIMHGIRHLDGTGLIKVEFIKESENLIKCTVEDNGIGRVKAKEIYASQKRTHNSKSTAITEERIKLLNASSHQSSIEMQYTDLCKDGEAIGTRVELLISI